MKSDAHTFFSSTMALLVRVAVWALAIAALTAVLMACCTVRWDGSFTSRGSVTCLTHILVCLQPGYTTRRRSSPPRLSVL